MPARIFLTSWSIRRKLLVFLLVIFLPVFGIIIASGLHYRRHTIETAENDALLLVQSLAAQQEKVATGTKLLLSTLARLPMVQRLDAEDCNKLFREIHQLYPSYSVIAAATPDGNMFASSLPFQPGTVNLADRKHIRDVIRTGDFSVGEYIIGKNSKKASLNYTYPVLDGSNTLIAIVIAGFKLDEYADFITEARLSESYVVAIADHVGVRLLRYPDNAATPVGKAIPRNAFEWVSSGVELGSFEKISEDGIGRFYTFKQVRLTADSPPYLYVVVGMAKDQILLQADLAMLRNLLFLGCITCAEIALIWFFGGHIFVRPINRLVTAAQRFGQGELSTRTDLPHTSVDLGQLAKSFDDMASQLEKRDTERLSAEETLRQSEEKYRRLFETQIDIYYQTDSEGRITIISPSVERISGFKPEELSGSKMRDFYVHPEDREPFLAAMREHGFVENYEISMRGKNGSIICMAVNARLNQDQAGNVLGIEGVARDITESKLMEEELREREELYRLLVTKLNDGFFMTDGQGILTFGNEALARIYGFDKSEDCIGKHIIDLVAPSAKEIARQIFFKAVSGGECPASFEVPTLRKNGEIVQTEVKPTIVFQPDGTVFTQGLLIDITDRKKAEEIQKAALQEKEILLREIHHRVKNNMQMISSLLSLQAERVKNEPMRQAFVESQQRIIAMAMIHETLYKGQNLASIDFSDYVKRLASHLHGVYNGQAAVRIILDLAEVTLSIDIAVPCGLIINELLTNAFKHAFPGEAQGTIQIKNYLVDGKDLVLEVSDNGVGLPVDLDVNNPSSLGLKLVKGLLEHQLRGRWEVSIGRGTTFTLRWPLPTRGSE